MFSYIQNIYFTNLINEKKKKKNKINIKSYINPKIKRIFI